MANTVAHVVRYFLGVDPAASQTTEAERAAAALRRCKVFLGNDTGTMHLAGTAGVPCVAVFSSREWPGMWFPYGVEQKVFRSQIECEGCGLMECVEKQNECLKRISTVEVLSACNAMLAARRAGSSLVKSL